MDLFYFDLELFREITDPDQEKVPTFFHHVILVNFYVLPRSTSDSFHGFMKRIRIRVLRNEMDPDECMKL